MIRSVTKAATINDRPVSGSTVHGVLVRRLVAAGIDPTGYSGHSLRAGFVTDAYTSGATAHEIMRQTGTPPRRPSKATRGTTLRWKPTPSPASVCSEAHLFLIICGATSFHVPGRNHVDALQDLPRRATI